MIKLIFALILFLLSLLVIFRAPTNFFWLVAVAVTSFPYVGMLLSVLSLYFGIRGGHFHWPVIAISGIAFLIFSLPVFSATKKSFTLPDEMAKVFPVKNDKELTGVFNFFNMFENNINTPFSSFPYKEIDGKKIMVDFYPAVSGNIAPLVIVIHGGSWQSGDNKQLPELNNYLASKGYNVAAIAYRLAPAYKAPAPVEDTRDAINYFLQHYRFYKIDTDNIVLLGRSAGGQIALSTAYSLKFKGIKGVISYYGPADMVWGGQVKVSSLVLNTDKIYNNYFGGLYKQIPEKFKESSAIDHADAQSPPTLMIHGEIDPLVSFQHPIHLQKKLDSLHVKNYFLRLPFATHGCDYSLKSPAGQVCTYAVERFLNSVTNR